MLKQAGIAIVSGMFGCVGEDYSTLETIRQTGGIAPDETWERNLENIRATVNGVGSRISTIDPPAPILKIFSSTRVLR